MVRERKRIRSHHLTGWLLVGPTLVLLLGVFAYPIGKAIWMSWFSQSLGTNLMPVFVGGGNYLRLVQDGRFWQSLGNTTLFTLVAVTLELLVGLAMALILDLPFRGRGMVRTIAILPWALPTALIALGWSWIFNDQFGVVNDLLVRLGLIQTAINWLGEPTLAMVAVIVADVWKTTSFVAVLLLAGLQAIPQDLYEAHAIDGASPWQNFYHITLPLLTPQILIAALFRLAQSFGIFDLVQVMTGGGPAGATETVSLYIYTTVMRYLDFGYGAALVVVTFLGLLLMVSLVSYSLTRFQVIRAR